MCRWPKSQLWDVEATVWGAPEIHGVYYKLPWLRREKEIADVAFLLILLTVYAFWP